MWTCITLFLFMFVLFVFAFCYYFTLFYRGCLSWFTIIAFVFFLCGGCARYEFMVRHSSFRTFVMFGFSWFPVLLFT